MSDESEKILRHARKLDKAETSFERRESMSPGNYVPESKGLIRRGGDIGGNSRVLRLTSIAQYRTKRRMMTAEKAGRSEQPGPALPAADS